MLCFHPVVGFATTGGGGRVITAAGSGGVCDGARFVVPLFLIVGFALKDLAEAGENWRHCDIFVFLFL